MKYNIGPADYIKALSELPIVRTAVMHNLCDGIPDTINRDVFLDIGLNMRTPIVNLSVDDDGIKGVLSFNYKPHYVLIPWHAVLWFGEPESAPPELVQAMLNSGERAKPRTRTEGNVVRVDFKRKRIM